MRYWLMGLILVGVMCRFLNLDYKLFAHDEVYTTLRSSGYGSEVVTQELFSDRPTTAPEILRYQQIKPNSTVQDTILSLAKEDPQHPPLYFLVNRWWIELFGSSVFAVRLLSAIIGTIGVPFMYLLGKELCHSSLAGWFASTLFALSPFDFAYAQISRQYSLLTVMVIIASYGLVRALKNNAGTSWGLYGFSSVIGLYTHPFFAFTIIAHGGYLLIVRQWHAWRRYTWAILGALVLYSPWLIVLVSNINRALGTTNWTQSSPDLLYVPKLWILSFTALFLDLDVGFDSIFTYLLRLPFLILFIWGIRSLFTHKRSSAGWFIVTNFAIPFLILALPDLLTGARRSAVSRYLISCFPAIQLASAYLFSQHMQGKYKFWWRMGFLGVAIASLSSMVVSLSSNTWWTNIPSYFNAHTVEVINQSTSPLLIVDKGYDGTNLGDLISLAYRLKPDVPIWLLSGNQNSIVTGITGVQNIFVFRPSGQLRSFWEQAGKELVVVPQTGGDLWGIGKGDYKIW